MANTPIVKHISECFIKPKHEVEDAKQPVYLAPGDLFLVSGHCIQTGLLFSNKPDTMDALLNNLKLSLSLALVHFYPLAGQLETDIDEERHTSFVFINCNKGPGARFIHATLDMRISEVLSPQDVPRVVHSFFDDDRVANHCDEHGRPLLSVQVTELVDGVFIGISMNHVCGDGASYWNFFNTLSEIFMAIHGGEKSNNIVISRSPTHKRWFLEGTGPIIKLPFIIPQESFFIERLQAPNLRERIFHFRADSISKLKARANEESAKSHNKISSFQALCGLVWRSITRARRSPDDSQTRCKLTISTRGRLNPPLSNNFFGNAVQAVQGESKVGELLSQNLGFAASKLHKAVKEYDDEKVRNGIKGWMESPFVVRNASHCDHQSVLTRCSARFDVYGNEFGMGKALAVRTGYANKFDGEVSVFPGRDGGGSVDLEIILLPDSMLALESDEEFMEVVSDRS